MMIWFILMGVLVSILVLLFICYDDEGNIQVQVSKLNFLEFDRSHAMDVMYTIQHFGEILS